MSLQTRLELLTSAIGADIKALNARIDGLVGGTDPWTYLVAPNDVSNSTVTAADVTGLVIPNTLVTGKYVIEGKILFTTGATTTGMQLGLVFPAQVELAALWQVAATQTTVTLLNQTTSAQFSGNTAAPVASPADSIAVLDGVFVVNGAMASGIAVQQRSEVATSAVVSKAGSFVRYRKIA